MTSPLRNLGNRFTIGQEVKVETDGGKHKAVNAYTGNIGKLMGALFGYQKCESALPGSNQVYYIKKSEIPTEGGETAAQLQATTEKMAHGAKAAPSTVVHLNITPLTSEEKRVLKELRACERLYENAVEKDSTKEARKAQDEFLRLCSSVTTTEDEHLAQFLTDAIDNTKQEGFNTFCERTLKWGIEKETLKSEDNSGNIHVLIANTPHNDRAAQLEKFDKLVTWSRAVKSEARVILFNGEAHLDALIAEQKHYGVDIDKDKFIQYFSEKMLENRGFGLNIKNVKKSIINMHFNNYVGERQKIGKAGKEAEDAAKLIYNTVRGQVVHKQLSSGEQLKFTTYDLGTNREANGVLVRQMRRQYADYSDGFKQPKEIDVACQAAHDAAVERVQQEFVDDMKNKGFITQIIGSCNDSRMITITLTKT